MCAEQRGTNKAEMFSKAIVGCLLLAVTEVVRSDLPVHCLHSETTGKWTIKMAKVSDAGNKEACGHSLPDKVMTMVDAGVDPDTPPFEVERDYTVTLEDPNIATGRGFVFVVRANDVNPVLVRLDLGGGKTKLKRFQQRFVFCRFRRHEGDLDNGVR